MTYKIFILDKALFDLVKSSLIFSLLFFTNGNVNGQVQQANSITISSPEVATLGKYAMQPPNYSNGLPQQSIPLYTIAENGINYPISLFYNFSGFNVKQEAGNVGFGWGITEGTIIRLVKGLTDESAIGHRKYEDNPDIRNLQFELGTGIQFDITGTIGNQYEYTSNRIFYSLDDGKPDVYVYNFNGFSGRFLWIKGKAFMLPHSDLKISQDAATSNFIVATPDGMEYTFAPKDFSWSLHQSEEGGMTGQRYAPGCGGENLAYPTYNDYGAVTCWRIIKARNNNTNAEISFHYSRYSYSVTTGGKDFTSVTFTSSGYQYTNNVFFHHTEFEPQSFTNNVVYFLDAVESDHVKIVLTPKTDRLDLPGSVAIKDIKVYFKNDLVNPVKTINFAYEYFGDSGDPNNSWLKLKKVMIGADDKNFNYVFSYVDEVNNNNAGGKSGFSIDHWGYYNGTGNLSLVPKTPTVLALQADTTGAYALLSNFTWADRTPHFENAVRYALEKIVYPTKGYTKITYGSGGGRGIRIANLEDNDGQQSVKKFYEYFPDDPIEAPNYNEDSYFSDACAQGLVCNEGTVPPRILSISGYSRQTLDFYDDNSNFYTKVTEKIGDAQGTGGKSEYNFYRDMFSYETLLTEESHYAYNNLTPVKKVVNTYDHEELDQIFYWSDPRVYAMSYSFSCTLLGTSNSSITPCCPRDPLDGHNYVLSDVRCSIYPIKFMWHKLTRTDTYDDTHAVRTKTYSYLRPPSYVDPDGPSGILHSAPLYVNFQKTVDYQSDGGKFITLLYYSDDASGAGITIPAEMLNRNMKSIPLKSELYLDNDGNGNDDTGSSNLKSYQISQFSYLNNQFILKTVDEVHPTGTVENVKTTYQYDPNAKLVLVQKENDIPTSYLWGYNQSSPIIKAQNSDNSTLSANVGQSLIDMGYQNGIADLDNFLASLGTLQTPAQKASWKLFNQKLQQKFSGTKVTLSTYTYAPLIGITSCTDSNDIATYYEYDDLGRLFLIRDTNSQVVSKYDYNFKK